MLKYFIGKNSQEENNKRVGRGVGWGRFDEEQKEADQQGRAKHSSQRPVPNLQGACRRALSQTGERVGVFILACPSTVVKGCPGRAQRPRPSRLSAHERKGTLVPRTVLWQRDPGSSCLSSCRLFLWGLWWDKADPFLLYSLLPSFLFPFPPVLLKATF